MKNKSSLTIKETTLSAQIAEWLDLSGYYNDRLNAGKIFTGKRVIHLCKPGTPDRFAIVEGLIVFIEVKKRGKTPTAEQLSRHEEIERKGKGIVITCDSFEDFEGKFKQTVQSIRHSR